MSDDEAVAVVGSGVAAAAAAATLRRRGVDVSRFVASGSDISSIWNGYGSVFGPAARRLPESAGDIERRADLDRGFTPHREARWRRLIERRGDDHPYRRFGLGRRDVEQHVAEVLDHLEIRHLTTSDDGIVRPGPRGEPAAPDVVASSLADLRFDGPTEVELIRLPGLDTWHAAPLADRLERAAGLDVRLRTVEPFATLRGTHPARAARELDERGATEKMLVDVVEDTDSEVDQLVLPPVVGATPDRHADWWAALAEAGRTHDVDVTEFPATQDAIFGWRLRRDVRPADAPRCCGIDIEDDADIRLRTESDTVSCRAVVVATDRWFGEGLPTAAPLVEPLSGTALWLDGTPIPPGDEQYPPRYLEESPWSDHPLFRAGLRVDRSARVVDRDGHPVEGLYAAGRLLSGFDPFRDGCSFGVDLVSGRRAGRAATPDASTPPETT